MTRQAFTPPLEAGPAWAALTELLTEHEPVCQSFAELWVGDDPADRDLAIDACQHCPSRLFTACGTYADAADEPWGVWAGVDRGRRTSKKGVAA